VSEPFKILNASLMVIDLIAFTKTAVADFAAFSAALLRLNSASLINFVIPAACKSALFLFWTITAFGKKMSKEELGGSHIHKTNGVTDNVADSEPGVE